MFLVSMTAATSRLEKTSVGQKLAPGFFCESATFAHLETPLQVTETHQENVTCIYNFASGCAVGPNSEYSDIEKVLGALGGPSYVAGMAARKANPDAQYIPAPLSVMGTRDYYLFRSGAAPASYKSGQGPDYLIEYGLSNFDKFTALGAGDVSQQLKDFVSNTAMALQVNLENAIRNNPALAGDRNALYDAAYATHVASYEQGGFGKLTIQDQTRAAFTPSFSDSFLSSDWWKTAPRDIHLVNPFTWCY